MTIDNDFVKIKNSEMFGKIGNDNFKTNSLNGTHFEENLIDLEDRRFDITNEEYPAALDPTPKEISDKRNSAKKRNKVKTKAQKKARKLNRRK